MRLPQFAWQMSWLNWSLGWTKDYDESVDMYSHFAFVGPLQLHWWTCS